ncbi:unnamed protein product, partial [Tenebrio molitor]
MEGEGSSRNFRQNEIKIKYDLLFKIHKYIYLLATTFSPHNFL